ncbi:multicopper oxidase family protein [Micromonospora sp. HM5-17]|uniref:multicopper oxidase family protein n=1 Tax=Micromonospora sp. HM5-17 TaxID=2487710 RepID=UPI000F476636|nr:multicopper oxidase family protein [Micromonospora sp. HM5-17]ROT32830.1 multicopper oxidase family protein [Micromonospora sp. HM5-17]
MRHSSPTRRSGFGAGFAAAVRRARLAFRLLVAAVLVTLARVTTVVLLASHGWWFVQEKVLLGLPMLGLAGTIAVSVAGRQLRATGSASPAATPTGSVVWLLTTGYAGLVGLLVSFLAGYPLTWSTALLAGSVVGAGALLTARVVATRGADIAGAADGSPATADDDARAEPTPAPPAYRGPAVSRRRFVSLAGGAVVVGMGGAGVGLVFRPGESVVAGGGPPDPSRSRSAVSVADLRGAAEPAPGGARRRYDLRARTATVRLPSGQEVEAWTYDGQVPGPSITATEGDLIEVTLHNVDIPDGVTLHWHGYDVPCGEDGAPGVTQHVVAPGETFRYRFRADQVGTYWYHTHQASHRGVRKGLYGALVVTPREAWPVAGAAPAAQLDLTLPVHTFDGTVVLADRDGRAEHAVPAGTPVRLRLINTDSDPHRVALAGTPFRVAAVDGRDLHQPGEVSRVGLHLAAGGRYDLVFVMPDAPMALVLDDDPNGGVRLRPDGTGGGDDPAGTDISGWPELDLLRYGTPAVIPFDADRADRHFTIVLDRGVAMVDGRPAYAQTVNGRGHPSVPDQLVAEGDVVRFTVVNRSLETHPWHLHGHSVLVLSRDGKPSSGSPLWVDTFDVRPGQVWEVAFKATNPGIWMNHCHNLPHAHQGMMLRLRYDGVTTPFGDSHGKRSGHRH